MICGKMVSSNISMDVLGWPIVVIIELCDGRRVRWDSLDFQETRLVRSPLSPRMQERVLVTPWKKPSLS